MRDARKICSFFFPESCQILSKMQAAAAGAGPVLRVLLRPAVQARPDVRVADLAGRRLEVRGEENWQSAAKIVSSPPATTLRAATGIWYVNIASRL